MYYVYILHSLKNNKRYTGFTSKNPNVRLQEHNQGGNLFTKYNGSFVLIYSESHADKNFAQKRERYFKTGHGRRYLKQTLSL